MNSNIDQALNALDCAALSYDDWLRVGMALKNEGYDVSVWEDWSRSDPQRFHEGECRQKWDTFRSAKGNAVTGGTIIFLAKARGWKPEKQQGPRHPADPEMNQEAHDESGEEADLDFHPEPAPIVTSEPDQEPASPAASGPDPEPETPEEQKAPFYDPFFPEDEPEDDEDFETPDCIDGIEVDEDKPFQTEAFLNTAALMNRKRGRQRFEKRLEQISHWFMEIVKTADQEESDQDSPRNEETGETADQKDKEEIQPPIPPAYYDTEDLIDYLEALFDPEDHVGYCTTGALYDAKKNKWHPGPVSCKSTAKELIDSLRAHPEDVADTFGPWEDAAGAWIWVNPLDGQGGKTENVTKFRHVLVESDKLPPDEQLWRMWQMKLPMAAVVSSAGKSVHAVVRVDAGNEKEYRERVTFLYHYLEEHGFPVDRANCNANRASRMPSVTRNGEPQRLLAVNVGRASWIDWMDFVEGEEDELPQLDTLEELAEDPPELPAELIQGVLRQGHKLLISGSSKAGKSFLLMELCIAIAEGTSWLSFPCRKGRVLYVNLEIDPASCVHRFMEIYQAMRLKPAHQGDILIWNLRGHAVPLDQLAPRLIRRVAHKHLDAIIIDPIYKVITGDENSASEMGAFCNQFDKICNETGCSVIYCHHHSKGVQGQKRAMDRASGSGVFARDPDAQLDMIELELSEELRKKVEGSEIPVTAWRMESSLREFPNFKPVNFWFRYPLHYVEREDELKQMPTQGSWEAGRMRNKKSKTSDKAGEEFRKAYWALFDKDQKEPTVDEMADYLNTTTKTVYYRARRMPDEFEVKMSIVHAKNNDQAPETPDELPEGQLEELIEQLQEYPMGVPVGKSSEQPKKKSRNTRGKN